MEVQKIEAYIRAHAQEEARRRRLFAYYDNDHDIRRRTLADASKPNNRLVHGYPRLISVTYTGYLLGNPIKYDTRDDLLLESINNCFEYNDEAAENALLGLDASICGYAYEIEYIDSDGMVRFRRVDPVTCIDIRDGTIEDNLTAVIRYYDTRDVMSGDTMRTVEVYEADMIRIYKNAGGALRLIEERENFFGDVPCVVYRNNSRGDGDFEGQITLIDAYNLMQSEGLNDQEYFSDAYMKLKGVQGTTDDDIAEMKIKRTLLLPNDADAEFLTKQQNDAAVENIKTRLNDDIHKTSCCPDMTDEAFAGNASGVAIKYKLWQFEQVTRLKEREFKRGLQRRIELLCNIWKLQNHGTFDWRDVKLTFKRSLPENITEIAQFLQNIGGVISDETKRTMLPLEIDEEKEKERLAAQAEAGLMLYSMPEADELE